MTQTIKSLSSTGMAYNMISSLHMGKRLIEAIVFYFQKYNIAPSSENLSFGLF